MKRAAGLVAGSLLAASMATSTTYFALEIHGGARVWSVDRPVQKGRVYLFHRFPDGVFTSLAVSEVEKVVSQAEAPPPAGGLAPGQSLYVGPVLSAAAAPAAPAAPPPPADVVMLDQNGGWGYSGYEWGGGGYVPPPRPPAPAPPTRIGPNGYPILSPPGSPGSTPPPIGANGFPILAPQAPGPQPRRPQ
ncbi:MAG TPA: hypothetical protein VMN82_05220 [Thermoanaerobaculia bacterium]|nr:hypothetical protein [Thermoanaerobaculia bacterium]